MKTRNQHTRRGATAVEMALVLSITLLFLFGLFEYGRLFMMKQVLENAAREGARYAVVHTNMDLSDPTGDPEKEIRNKIKSYLVGLETKVDNFDVKVTGIVLKASGSSLPGDIRPSWTDAKETDGIKVEVSGDFEPIIPAFLRMNAVIPLKATALMYSEAN